MAQDYVSWIRSKVGHDKIFLPVASGILADEKHRVLLQRRGDNGKWGIIGGCMELGESSLETLQREFLEETGLSITAKRLLNVYTNKEGHYPNGDVAQTVSMVYEVACLEEIDLHFKNSETLELRFFSEEEIRTLDLAFKKHRIILEEYFKNDFAMGW